MFITDPATKVISFKAASHVNTWHLKKKNSVAETRSEPITTNLQFNGDGSNHCTTEPPFITSGNGHDFTII